MSIPHTVSTTHLKATTYSSSGSCFNYLSAFTDETAA